VSGKEPADWLLDQQFGRVLKTLANSGNKPLIPSNTSTSMKKTFAIFHAVILSSCITVQAADLAAVIESAAKTSYHFSPPADACIINVKDHGAKGDGTSDDTAAVLAAVAHSARHGHFRDTVFSPKGSYLLSDQISTGEGRFFAMTGEERDTTVIRLKDGTAGFGDSTNPKPFFEIGGGG